MEEISDEFCQIQDENENNSGSNQIPVIQDLKSFLRLFHFYEEKRQTCRDKLPLLTIRIGTYLDRGFWHWYSICQFNQHIQSNQHICPNIETAMLSRHAESVNTCGWWWQERWLVSRVVLTSSSSQVPPILLFLPPQPIDTNNASGTRKPISWRTQNILRRLAIVML